MGSAKYLVAKYVPDLFRNEPVNVGVLTWIDGRVASKFLGQDSDGNINGRTAGIFGRIKSVPNYRQWIKSWDDRLKQKTLFSRQHGNVSSESEEFLDALASYSNGSYILEAGGKLMDNPDPSELPLVTDYLFETLVGTPPEKEQWVSPEQVRDTLLREANVLFDDNVKRNVKISLELRGKTYSPEFDLYIGNGTPQVLGHMVPLTVLGRRAQNYARAAELQFYRILESNILTQDRCFALVYTRGEDAADELIQESLEELSAVATVLNISRHRTNIVKSIAKWVEESKNHN